MLLIVCFVVLLGVVSPTLPPTTLRNMFSLLFHSRREIMTYNKSSPLKLGTIKKSTAPWWTRTGGHVHPGTVDSNIDKRSTTTSCDSCETIWSCSTPLEVDYDGKTFDVYVPPSHYQQIVFKGECSSLGSACGKNNDGECAQDSSYYMWILVVDESLGVDPRIKFLPVGYDSHCYCSNPGKD